MGGRGVLKPRKAAGRPRWSPPPLVGHGPIPQRGVVEDVGGEAGVGVNAVDEDVDVGLVGWAAAKKEDLVIAETESGEAIEGDSLGLRAFGKRVARPQ